MPHEPSPYSLLHLVSPTCSFARMGPSLPARSPLHRTQMPVATLAQLPEHLHPISSLLWEPCGAKSSMQAVCPTWGTHFKHVRRPCYQIMVSLNVCVCVVFAHQLKLQAHSVSPSPLSAPMHQAVNGHVHLRTLSSPSPLSATHGLLCCSCSCLFWRGLQF